jgi:hypothetical protein
MFNKFQQLTSCKKPNCQWERKPRLTPMHPHTFGRFSVRERALEGGGAALAAHVPPLPPPEKRECFCAKRLLEVRIFLGALLLEWTNGIYIPLLSWQDAYEERPCAAPPPSPPCSTCAATESGTKIGPSGWNQSLCTVAAGQEEWKRNSKKKSFRQLLLKQTVRHNKLFGVSHEGSAAARSESCPRFCTTVCASPWGIDKKVNFHWRRKNPEKKKKVRFHCDAA